MVAFPRDIKDVLLLVPKHAPRLVPGGVRLFVVVDIVVREQNVIKVIDSQSELGPDGSKLSGNSRCPSRWTLVLNQVQMTAYTNLKHPHTISDDHALLLCSQ